MNRLQLFGRAVLNAPEPVSGPAGQRQRLALLALLALARDAGMSRDKLIALLWPETDTERGRHLLSNSIYVLRHALGADAILTQGDALRLNPGRIRSDAGDFLDAIEQGDDASAVCPCTAPFMDGFFLPGADEFERWVAAQRDRLARACAGALERLAERAQAEGDLRGAAAWWQRLVDLEPYSSRAVLRLMHALAAAGDPADAIQHARRHEKRLRDDLEAELPDEVAAFAAQLCGAGRNPARPAGGVASASVRGEGALVPTAAAVPGRIVESPTVPAASDAAAARRARRSTVLVGLAMLPLLAAGAALLRPDLDRVPTVAVAAPKPVRSIAVLPFVNLSPDSSDEYFSDGLTEELINRLAQVAGLRVAARTSSFTFRETSVDVGEIGRRLNVELVLLGSVRRDGDRLRITAQLVNVADGYHVWSRTWEERAPTAIFEIQDEISRQIVASVRPELSDSVQTAPGTTRDVRAYEEYHRGRYVFWQGRSAANLNAAIRHYQAAIARDSGYALAYAGLADAYMLLPGPPAERMRKAKAAALRALALDDELSEGYVSLASINWFYDWDWKAAERNYRRSFSVNRLVYTRCICYVWYLAAIGDMDGAVREARRARAFDPLALLPLTTLAEVYLAAGRDDDLRSLLPALREAGANPGMIGYLTAWLEWNAGRPDRALAELEDVRAGRDPHALAASSAPVLVTTLAFMYAETGRDAEARALAEALRARAATKYVPPVQIASAFASAGDTLEAARWLRAAHQERANLAYFAMTPQARPLQSLGTFRTVLAAAGPPAGR